MLKSKRNKEEKMHVSFSAKAPLPHAAGAGPGPSDGRLCPKSPGPEVLQRLSVLPGGGAGGGVDCRGEANEGAYQMIFTPW
jgi:hypothetical protein